MSDYEIYFPKFLELFKGRDNVLAYQADGGGYYPKRNVRIDPQLLDKHFNSLITIGQYVVNSENCCHYCCIDIDTDKKDLDEYNFKDFNLKVNYLGADLNKYINFFIKEFKINEDYILLEDSGGRGLHFWVFFDESIEGIELKKLDKLIRDSVKPVNGNYEFFPKQAEVEDIGNCIKLPLGLHRKYNRMSFFFKKLNNEFTPIVGIEENLKYLNSIKTIPKKTVLQKTSHLSIPDKIDKSSKSGKNSQEFTRIKFNGQPIELINSCKALKRLHQKAISGIEFSRPEAFHYASSLLCFDNSEPFIKNTISKSFATKYSEAKTEREIESIKNHFPTTCLKLKDNKICEEFCSENIVTNYKDGSLKSKIPASVFFHPITQEIDIKGKDIKTEIVNLENIELSFIKLKKYGKQGTLFFDEFDFHDFENQLLINCRFIHNLLKSTNEIPIEGYSKFKFPKKIDENNQVSFRNLAYSPVFDQVIIQSVFNYVGVILDSQLSENVIGYRVDNSIKSDNIFQDWKELYPIYRNKIINCIASEDAKFFIYCDIEKFYDKVDHDIILTQIKGSIDKFSFDIVKQHIQDYNFDDSVKGMGLPQGPAFARILANYYLIDFDKICEKISTHYFRYVDDLFIFFDSEENAKKGLEEVTKFLKENLNLSFSTSEEKKAVILDTSKNSNLILDKFRKAWYLEKNEFRKLEGSSYETIKSFFKKVDEKIKIEIKDIEDLNREIYSFLYLSSGHHILDSELRLLIKKSIPYLVENKRFFPKDAKQVFRWLFQGSILDNNQLTGLFNHLHETHQIIFLFELKKYYYVHGLYGEVYIEILKNVTKSNYPYIKGLGIILLFKENLLDFETISFTKIELNNSFLINKLPTHNNILQKIRENYNIIDFSKLKLSAKKKILSFYTDSENVDLQYKDSFKLKELIDKNSFLLIPEICELFIKLKDDDSTWEYLMRILTEENLKHKSFILNILDEKVTDVYNNENNFIIQNQLELFDKISDDETKSCLKQSLEKIHKYDSSYERKYNFKNSDYYVKNESNESYEILNWSSIERLIGIDIDDFIKKLKDLSSKNIIAEFNYKYNSENNFLLLEFKNDELRYVDIKDIIEGLGKEVFNLITDLYSQSNYVYYLFDRCPLISEQNLFYDKKERNFVFKSIGSLFNQTHIILDQSFDIIIKKSIPQMIGYIFNSLYFDKETRNLKYNGYYLYLIYWCKRLNSDNPISLERIRYLNTKIQNIDLTLNHPSLELYLYERFKGQSLINSKGFPNWSSITKSYISTIEISKQYIDFIPYTKYLYSYRYPFKELSILSKYLWKFNVLGNTIYNEKKYNKGNIYFIFQLVNHFSILVTEIICLVRVLDNKKELKELNILGLKSENWTYELPKDKLSQLIDLNNKSVFDSSYYEKFDLSILWLFAMLNTLKTSTEDKYLLFDFSKNKKGFYYLTLFKELLELEDVIYRFYNELINQTYQNLDLNTELNFKENIDKIINSLFLIKKVRKSIPDYERKTTSYKEYNGFILVEQQYLNIPLSKSKELFFHTNTKTIDIYKNKIKSVISPENSITELWSFIYKFNRKSVLAPVIIFLIWVVALIVSKLLVNKWYYAIPMSLLLMIIGMYLKKYLERIPLIQKSLKWLNLS